MFYEIYRILPQLASSNLTPLRNGESLLTDSIILDALIVMGVGFASVFVVLTIIYFVCQLLNRLFPEKVEAEE